MAFFEELGKKISETGQGVMQKTKDTAEILKLNSLVSDEEKKINSYFYQIGKAYYEIHADSAEQAFAGMVAEIKNSQNNIADYNEQISRLKGLVRCPNCNGEVAYGAPFCSSCGSAMPVAAPAASAKSNAVCAKCGAPLADGALFCTSCGNKVEASAAPEQATPTSALCCPKCGIELPEGTKFCIGCGTMINN